jgi:hypothetical protein
VPHILRRALALWFVLQIVLPFTAPLQTCSFKDLFGKADARTIPTSPESTSTPTPSEAESEGPSFVSPLAAFELRASAALAVLQAVSAGAPAAVSVSVLAARNLQNAVLRL